MYSFPDFSFPISVTFFIAIRSRLVFSNPLMTCLENPMDRRTWWATVHGVANNWTQLKRHFCFIDYAKTFDCVDHKKLWKRLKEMGIPDHLICLLRNLYSGQEATVRIGHGATDWFQIEKGVR